ncbi:MAG: MFS transporter, partial [Acidobacteriota bacterium]|nr:MFS transporter [Acidobacteriota bacterium]
GLLWLPLWALVSKRIRPEFGDTPATVPVNLDRRLAILVAANVMWMGIYSLWTNWTTLYLQRVHHLTLLQTARYAWVPPLASNLGGFIGGWLALRWIAGGMPAVPARVRVILLSALGGLFTLLVPFAPGPGWAIAAISLSFCWTLAGSVNVYTLPIDLYGAGRAGTAISALVFAYGLLQTVISPVIGKLVMTAGYGPVCWMVALPPLGAWLLLRWGVSGAKAPYPK